MSQQSIPKEGKAAIIEKKGGPIVVKTVPVRQPKDLKPGEALVHLKYSGVCHTDLHALLGDWPIPVKANCVGGHEGAGEIVAIGEHTQTDLKVGDRVGIKWIADSCNRCQFCRQGYEPLCQSAQCSGYTVDGSFAQYAVSYTSQLSLIPDNLPFEDAAPILCAGVTVYKALKEANVKAGEWIVVAGSSGGLGHLAVQYAAYQGLRVIGIDTGKEKEELSKKMGAEVFIDFKTEKDIVKAVKAATPDGLGPHAAICTASSSQGYTDALEQVRPHGTVVAVGLPPDTKIQADVFTTVLYSKRIVGSYVGNRQDAHEALSIAASGRVKTHYRIEPLDKLPQIFDDMHAGKLTGRVVLRLD